MYVKTSLLRAIRVMSPLWGAPNTCYFIRVHSCLWEGASAPTSEVRLGVHPFMGMHQARVLPWSLRLGNLWWWGAARGSHLGHSVAHSAAPLLGCVPFPPSLFSFLDCPLHRVGSSSGGPLCRSPASWCGTSAASLCRSFHYPARPFCCLGEGLLRSHIGTCLRGDIHGLPACRKGHLHAFVHCVRTRMGL